MTTIEQRKLDINQRFHGGKMYLKMLERYLKSSEEDTLIDDVFASIENNLKDPDALEKCNLVLNRFTYKAIQTNYSDKWLQIIDKLISAHENFNIKISSQIYISKSLCLGQFSTLNPNIEKCLHKAKSLSGNYLENIEALIRLAYYYDGVSMYTQMEEVLLEAESLCKIHLGQHIYTAEVWCALGCLNFIIFNLNRAKKYFEKSLNILNYLEINDDNSILTIKFAKVYNTCFHYLGRIKLENHCFKDCIDLYIQSEAKLIDFCRNNAMTQDFGATAFYHLRIAQVLDICGLTNYADYHYQQSKHYFEKENPFPSGLSQITLAISKQEEEIKKAIKQNAQIGYGRGYLMASIKLFMIYCKTLKFHLAFVLIGKIFFELFTNKSINFRYIFILLKQIFLSSYGLGIYTRIKVMQLKMLKSDKILTICPCSEAKCKTHVTVKQK